MTSRIEKLIQKWGDNNLSTLRLRICSLENWLYHTYEPDKFGGEDFEDRLANWLDNVEDEEDKKTLFKLITEIFYIGPTEFEELYRCAYQGPVARWLTDMDGIDICATDAQEKLKNSANNTWFCPISDSFRINAFFHINNLAAGASLRPDWRSLRTMGDISKIQSYYRAAGITKLVLLEDFVGGGSQAGEAIAFVTHNFCDLEILFVPLIICPSGATLFRDYEEQVKKLIPKHFKFEPVMELPPDAFLTQTTSPFTNKEYTHSVHELLRTTYPAVSGGVALGTNKPYTPYGYPPDCPTGGMVVMYSNTPDNTLPIIHWRPKSDSWKPLFPRHSRD